MILLSADVSALIDLFKQCGEMLAGVGFVCAGLAVIKKIITKEIIEKQNNNFDINYHVYRCISNIYTNMVAYINIQMTEYLATNYSLFDLAIVTIVIVSILILGLVYFSGSKKKTECTASLSVEEEKSDSDLVLSPRITIVFQKDLSDDEELSREIADMYISNRAYYYAGKIPPFQHQVLSEKSDDVFVKYESVDFSALSKIDI